MKKDEFSTILVELDAILDTRAATLRRHFPIQSRELLLNGWHDRWTDTFDGVDPEAFREAYLARDEETVLASMATPAVQLINRFVQQTIQARFGSPYIRYPKVEINLHPYKLSESVVTNLLKAIAARAQGFADVTATSISQDELTPTLVRDNYPQLLMYHWTDWFAQACHAESFSKEVCISNILIGPLLLKDKAAIEHAQDPTVLGDVMTHYRQFVSVNFLPLDMFSFDAARYLKTARGTAGGPKPSEVRPQS